MSDRGFRVTLEPLPGGNVPPLVRLRLGLKVLLRAFRLRCTGIEEIEARPGVRGKAS